MFASYSRISNRAVEIDFEILSGIPGIVQDSLVDNFPSRCSGCLLGFKAERALVGVVRIGKSVTLLTSICRHPLLCTALRRHNVGL